MATTYESICNLAMTRLGATVVTDVVTAPAAEPNDELCNKVYEKLRDEVLAEHNWQFAKRTLPLNLADGTAEALFDEIDITGITQADPAVVTAASHGFLDGWLVKIDDVVGMTEINGKIVRVSQKAADTFECYGLNSTEFTAYTSGGKAIRYEAIGVYESGFIYDVPADMLKPISLIPAGYDFEELGSGNSRRILTAIEDAILVYTAKVTTAIEFSDEFIDAYWTRIAAELAMPITKDQATIKNMWDLYIKTLEESKLKDLSRSRIKFVEKSPTLDDGGYTI
jgi:hypothetical protein